MAVGRPWQEKVAVGVAQRPRSCLSDEYNETSVILQGVATGEAAQQTQLDSPAGDSIGGLLKSMEKDCGFCSSINFQFL